MFFTPSIVDLFVKIEKQMQIELIYLAVKLIPGTLRKNPGHSDVIYVVENVLNYFLWLNSSNGWPINIGTKSGRSD